MLYGGTNVGMKFAWFVLRSSFSLIFVAPPDGHGENGVCLEPRLHVHFLVEARVSVHV